MSTLDSLGNPKSAITERSRRAIPGPASTRALHRSNAMQTAAEVSPLVVLVGLPRSGTTWIAKILDSHPDTTYRHEPDSRGGLGGVPFAPELTELARNASAVRAFAAGLRNLRTVRVTGKQPLFPKRGDAPGAVAVQRAAVAVAKLVGRLGIDLPVLTTREPDPRAWLVWKSIESTARLGLLARALPEAKIVHIVRHPCGYADSVLRGSAERRFSSSTAAWNDGGVFEMLRTTRVARRELLARHDPARLAPAARLGWLWAVQNEKAFDETEGFANVLRVRYEDLCNSPQTLSRALFEKLGLAWSQQTEAFVKQSTSQEHASYYAVFKNPTRSAQAWRTRMDDRTTTAILEVAAATRVFRWYAGSAIDHADVAPPATVACADGNLASRTTATASR